MIPEACDSEGGGLCSTVLDTPGSPLPAQHMGARVTGSCLTYRGSWLGGRWWPFTLQGMMGGSCTQGGLGWLIQVIRGEQACLRSGLGKQKPGSHVSATSVLKS